MTRNDSDRLRELCLEAESEKDPDKLMALIQQIERLLEMKEEPLRLPSCTRGHADTSGTRLQESRRHEDGDGPIPTTKNG